jgi:hypothetical protein
LPERCIEYRVNIAAPTLPWRQIRILPAVLFERGDRVTARGSGRRHFRRRFGESQRQVAMKFLLLRREGEHRRQAGTSSAACATLCVEKRAKALRAPSSPAAEPVGDAVGSKKRDSRGPHHPGPAPSCRGPKSTLWRKAE